MTEAVADSGIFHRIAKFFVENQGKRSSFVLCKNSNLKKTNQSPDERTTGWFLSGSMTPLIIILVTYLYFCLYAGPRYMAKRKPFKLEGVLIAYNAIQVVLSIWLVYEVR